MDAVSQDVQVFIWCVQCPQQGKNRKAFGQFPGKQTSDVELVGECSIYGRTGSNKQVKGTNITKKIQHF